MTWHGKSKDWAQREQKHIRARALSLSLTPCHGNYRSDTFTRASLLAARERVFHTYTHTDFHAHTLHLTHGNFCRRW
jgi:hypothetical protein